MGLYLGKEKLCSCDELVYTSNSMKMFFDAGGKLRDMATVTSVDELFQKSDTADVTDMSYMFYYCRSLTSVPEMNTGSVTDMRFMFAYCTKLTSVPAMDTSKVTDMGYMFSSCSSLTSVPAMDTGNVTSMSNMLAYCTKLTSVPEMNTGNVTSMSQMFYVCSSLTSVPAMDTSKVTNMGYMFSSCSSLAEIHMYGMKVSFDISASTKFTREALVEILNNLATITSSKTLTMGSTNLAKLTDDDKAIATGKGWTLK